MNYNLNILNRLKDINEEKDIKALSHAIFPGTHCPLFGVALTASYIEDLFLLVVGTSECSYYTKNFTYHRQKGMDKVYSLILKDKDIIFGADKKVKNAVKEIYNREKPSGIMIVTTCVPELIGEDYVGLVEDLKEELETNIFVTRTEHYKCSSHIPGMRRALAQLINVMEKSDVSSGINILGHRDDSFEKTELIQILKKNNIGINAIIPSKCSLDSIKTASSAKVNIVTDMIALDLAKDMKERFSIPFIFFDKHMNKDIIEEKYREIEKELNISIGDEIESLKNEYEKVFERASKLLNGKSFIYGNTPMQAFETSEFLVSLNAKPKLIQVRELYDVDIVWKKKIEDRNLNPYITRIANIAPLRELYEEIGADLYIGHESPVLLKEKGMIQLTFDSHGQKIGYELPIGIMKSLIEKISEEEN
ncbi:MAG: nitrogenase component 1 [Clostridium sp.]